jgi:hypothetical protein
LDPAACAIGRVSPDGPWGGSRQLAATPDDLLALALAYFEESLDPPPDELAATHGDIGSLVRHLAEHEPTEGRRRLLDEAVDAVDDGLAADVTIGRLTRLLGEEADASSRIRLRVDSLID